MEDLVRQVKLLKIYVVLLTLIVITFIVLYAALLRNTGHYKEITAERISIVDSGDRLFLGKTSDGETGLLIRDDKGIPRIRICINKQNQPVIQTLNDKGEVIKTR